MRRLAIGLFLVALAWATPAAAADDCADMLSFTGAPEYKGDPPDHTILCRKGYVLSHNTKRLTPDWVLEVLTPQRLASNKATRQNIGFKADPDLPENERARPRDYENQTGKQRYAQGHMAPAADMKFDREAMTESFYLSNIAPQVGPQLNAGIWSDLERLTRQWTCGHDQLVIISGPIYGDRPQTIGVGEVAVPKAFYKIAYEPERKRIVAFVLPNKAVDKKGKRATEALKKYLVKVLEIEDQVGLSFLDGLTVRDRRRLRNSTPAMWTRADDC